MTDHSPDVGKMVARPRTVRIFCIRHAPRLGLWCFQGVVGQRGMVNSCHQQLAIAYECVDEQLSIIEPSTKWRPLTTLADIESYFALIPTMHHRDFQAACAVRWEQVE